MGAFEDFVNLELPKRISTEENGAGSGNLPAGFALRTTGIGLGVETVPTMGGGDVAEYTTLLTVIHTVDAGASFFVDSSGTHYIKEKDDGDLLPSEAEFLANEKVQIYLNGNKATKGEDVTWTSRYSFTFGFAVDPGDRIEIIS